MRTFRSIVPILLALAIVACGRGALHQTPDAFVWNDALPAGSTLHLRDLTGSIRVVASNEAAVRVRASKSWRGREPEVRFLTNRRGNDMYVCAVWGSSGRCDEHGYRSNSGRRGIMRVLGIFSLRKSKRGQATVNFEVALPPGVRIDASTVMGDVTAEGVSAGSELQSVNGDVRLAGTGSLSGHSTNGDVTIAVTTLGASDTIRARSVNGGVEVTVPAAYEGAVEMKTVNGEISTDFPVSATGSMGGRTLSGTIGTAPRLIELSTVNGEVRIRKS